MEDALALADLRERQGVTQVEVATRLGVNQGNISRIEHREDLYLSTLRGYVAALGGELQLVARFPDGAELRVDPTKLAGEPLPAG
jgi:transcriptional regulator with XRE-family HTH domain